MLKRYSDKSERSGYLLTDLEQFEKDVARWTSRGYQVACHAIGDKANHIVVEAYCRNIEKDARVRDLRLRIEHAQITAPEDVRRAAQCGLIASMQPTHATSDKDFAEKRLGRHRAQTEGYVWKSFLDSQISALAFGSDFPTVGEVPPILGLFAAISRQDTSGLPSEGWFPEQRVSRYQALKSYTMDAAFASHAEDYLGSLESGKAADFVVLSQDIMDDQPPLSILKTSILGTFIDGKPVYTNPTTSLEIHSKKAS